MIINGFLKGTTPAPTTTQPMTTTPATTQATTTYDYRTAWEPPFCSVAEFGPDIGWVCNVQWFVDFMLPDDVWTGPGLGSNVDSCNPLLIDAMPTPAYRMCQATWSCSSPNGHYVDWPMDIDWENDNPAGVFGPGGPGILQFAFSECHCRLVEAKTI